MRLEAAVRIGQLIGFGISFAVGIHCDRCDFLLSDRTILHTGLGLCNSVHNFYAGSDLAEGGVLAV